MSFWFIVFIVIYIGVLLYVIRQIFNKYKINYGKVKIYENEEEKEILTNNHAKFNYYFGSPGSGKTTFLSYIAKCYTDYNKKLEIKGLPKLNIYSNVHLKDIDYIYINKNDIGTKNIHDGVLLIDESSINFNNRAYKTMGQHAIEYFKYHRHYCISVCVFSQAFDDTDITLRRLCNNYYLLKKSKLYFINKQIICRSIDKFIDINKDDKQVIDGYEFKFFSTYRLNAKKYFKYFNSYERNLVLDEFD